MSNLPVINLFDSNFPGHACSVPGQTPRLMRYEREQLRWDGLTIFTDGQMYSPIVGEVTSRYKIGWLMESQALHPENYYRLPYYEQKFDAILTTRPELLARDPQRYRLGIRGGVWTPRAQWGMHPKSRSISMILSDKRTSCATSSPRRCQALTCMARNTRRSATTNVWRSRTIATPSSSRTSARRTIFPSRRSTRSRLAVSRSTGGAPNIEEYLGGWSVVPFADIAELREHVAARTGDAWRVYYEIERSAAAPSRDRLADYEVTEDWLMTHALAPFVGGRNGAA
jgi:hypothetical protein